MRYLHLLSLVQLTANHSDLAKLILEFKLTKEFCLLMDKEILFMNNNDEVYINKKHMKVLENFGSILETTIDLTTSN
jgi:hypothetical protein